MLLLLSLIWNEFHFPFLLFYLSHLTLASFQLVKVPVVSANPQKKKNQTSNYCDFYYRNSFDNSPQELPHQLRSSALKLHLEKKDNNHYSDFHLQKSNKTRQHSDRRKSPDEDLGSGLCT